MKRLSRLAVVPLLATGTLALAADAAPAPHPGWSRPGIAARWTTADGLRVRVAEQGNARGAAPVVLIHGYGESLVGWRQVMERLARERRVIAFDVPPFGLSDKPPAGYSASRLAAVVADLIRETDSSGVVLVGHSMGGELAGLVAVQYPELVRRLVLVDPAGLGGNRVAEMGVPGPVVRGLAMAWQGVVTALLPSHDPAWLAETDSALDYNPNGDAAYYAAIDALLREFDFVALEGRLALIRAPTLVIWGEHDRLFPLDSVGRRFAGEIPGASLVVIRRAFHRPHASHPDQLVEAISAFLRQDSVAQ